MVLFYVLKKCSLALIITQLCDSNLNSTNKLSGFTICIEMFLCILTHLIFSLKKDAI